MSTRVAFQTLGCRVNQADTIALEDEVRSRDGQLVHHKDVADIYVVNTCTVTHGADADARKMVRRAKRLNPDAQVVVTGCYAQVAPEALMALPEVDLVVGNEGKQTLIDKLMPRTAPAPEAEAEVGAQQRGLRLSPRRMDRLWPSRVRKGKAHITALPETRTRPFIKVQDGCDYSCAFCIIPQARGISRSFSLEYVQRQLSNYAALGAREVVLTGIHLGHWGKDLTPRVAFDEMLSRLLEGLDPRIARLRLGSVEPNEVTPRLIALLRDHPTLCPHLHVPLQSADNEVLRRMRRLYTVEQYEQVILSLRQALPTGAIGADVMVGHPGETDQHFERGLRVIDGLPWTYLHVFPFSPRRGTASSTMDDQVHPSVKTERMRALIRRSDVRRHLHYRSQVGLERQWLVLQSKQQGYKVLSDNYVPGVVYCPADKLHPGDLFNAKVSVATSSGAEVQLGSSEVSGYE
ncbi:MAG TPA: tRNA (N(6)-L-threonylcarbamoyladenosine(37)-C(2))-methylthiotransferase MtaB [Myxococcales bacterium]|nr:tRNA (N(6)-L-threonylcarbamoyladenosine(37)-C(2))-methylthiotransferase MtaB [Myxococcales bacterium]